jgi:hypothetical protein
MEWETGNSNPLRDIENAKRMFLNPYYDQCHILTGAKNSLEWEMYCRYMIGKGRDAKLKERLNVIKNRLKIAQINYKIYDSKNDPYIQ